MPMPGWTPWTINPVDLEWKSLLDLDSYVGSYGDGWVAKFFPQEIKRHWGGQGPRKY